ncbi:sce7726 family protein [Clostridium intestinale]|uniref:sce7726 family protein n=1 Tax=Clostridium intestinale TaxID=36845 RepID=UPI002DD6A9C1|nr:sce7726 family protein [Clostridium intestinale]WRY52585.1 sce7726 family protein [Clostridium intestinale]
MTKTRDIDIRTKLHNDFFVKYHDDKSTIIVDELNLCQGDARIDVAVINGSIHGYEIKSESDNLLRLPKQILTYSKVMDYMTLVVSDSHYEKAKDILPEWWGIKVVINKERSIEIRERKKPKKNKYVDSFSLVQLLWKDEALDILKEKKLDRGFRSKSRLEMWEQLAKTVPIDDLKEAVREKLKSRMNWKVD